MSIAGYVNDWTLSTKVAVDELQVGDFSITCSEKRLNGLGYILRKMLFRGM